MGYRKLRAGTSGDFSLVAVGSGGRFNELELGCIQYSFVHKYHTFP